MKSNLKTELTLKQVNICEIAKLLRNFLKMSGEKARKRHKAVGDFVLERRHAREKELSQVSYEIFYDYPQTYHQLLI